MAASHQNVIHAWQLKYTRCSAVAHLIAAAGAAFSVHSHRVFPVRECRGYRLRLRRILAIRVTKKKHEKENM